MSKYCPLNDCVLIDPEPEEDYAAFKGLTKVIVPDAFKHGPEDRPKWGKVISKGRLCRDDEVRVGARVLYAKYGWAKLNYAPDKFYAVAREYDLLAIDC